MKKFDEMTLAINDLQEEFEENEIRLGVLEKRGIVTKRV